MKPRRPPNHSRAWVDAVVCPLPVDARDVRALLPPQAGLSLVPAPRTPRGRHPVIIELWQVHDGALETAGMDAHDWSELAGTAAGFGVGGSSGAMAGAGVGAVAGAAGGGALGMLLGPIGLAWGAAFGATAGATTAAAVGATAGALWGARWVGGMSRRASLVGSRVLGSYAELLVTIPYVVRRGDDDDDDDAPADGVVRAFSAAMYADSTLSRFGERALGFGYRKQSTRITVDAAGAIRVQSRDRLLLEVSVSPQPADRGTPPSAGQVEGGLVRAALGQPLLGARSGRTLAVSHLDRAFDAPSARVAGASVTLNATAAFLDGAVTGRRRLESNASSNPWGAFIATGVPVRLSYPRRAR